MNEDKTKEKELYKAFADALCNNTDEQPRFVSKDAAYCMKLQRDKMKSLGLSSTEELSPGGALNNDAFGNRIEGRQHYGYRLFSGFIRKTNYLKNGKKIAQRKEKMILYQTILQAKESIDPNSTECCPSCGAVSTLAELEHGCPYCKASFLMSELYPKVTDYFWLHDYSMSSNEMKKRLIRWCGVFGLIFAAIGFFVIPGSEETFVMAGKIFRMIFCGLTGVILGLVTSGIPLLIKVFSDAAKAVPILSKTAGDKKRLDAFMRQYDPNFFYELFESRVISLMKIMLYGGGTSDSAVYCGKTPFSSDVIDAAYIGAIDIERSEQQGDYLWITLSVYADCTHFKNGKIIVSRDQHRMRIFKRSTAITDPGFSMHKVECFSCAASFDASKTKNCPYCGRDYHLYDHDWTVDMIEKSEL